MKTFLRYILAGAVALGIVASAHAQAPAAAPYGEAPRFSQAELDSMLAPIALYPDSLLSQLMMAATYPRDIAEAAAWSRENRHLAGEEAVRAVANQPWDPSVKSLVAFPQVLAMLDEHMEWTERLGDAFMGNPAQVSDTIQVLRGRADQAGNLRSDEQMRVERDYGNYVIEPASPETVYVPYYDPRVVYGSWWWPDYAPVWWSPWAGYAWTPGYAFAWGYGVTLGGGFWYSSFDWPRRYVRFHSHRPYYYRGHSRSHGHRWHSDRDHNRNTRGWHSSGYYRGDDGRSSGRRDWQRGGNGRDGRGEWQRGGENRDSRGINRTPTEQRYTVPPGGRTTERPIERSVERSVERQPSQPLSRGAIAQPQREYSPSSQPLSRGAIAPAMPAPAAMPAPTAQPSQPLRRERVPVAQPAPVPQAVPAPSAPPASRGRPVERESRPEPSERSESRPERAQSESRPEPAARGGGNSLGRGGGRVDRQ
jgi:hypothetical protein